jgi:hypothetical protein
VSDVELPDQIDALSMGWQTKAILHGLFETGRLTSLTCQEEDCVYVGVPFAFDGSSLQLVIDHDIARRAGGTDRLSNLRPIHSGCNIARAWRGAVDTRVASRVKGRKAAYVPVSCVPCREEFCDVSYLANHQPCDGHFACGHARSPENTSLNKASKSRSCRTCKAEYQRSYRERKAS